MNTNSKIYLSQNDFEVINFLINGKNKNAAMAERLSEELSRAVVLDAESIPDDTVGLDSEVQLMDLDTQVVETYILTLPVNANAEVNRISVLAPIGAALLGYREGDTIEWPTPGGVRHLEVLKVVRKCEEAKRHAPYELLQFLKR